MEVAPLPHGRGEEGYLGTDSPGGGGRPGDGWKIGDYS